MRTSKLFTSVIAALALMYSSGCCETYENQAVPVYNCPPGYQMPVTYEPCATVLPAPVAAPVPVVSECPPGMVKVKKVRKARKCPPRYNRRAKRFAQVKGTAPATYVNYVPGYGTATLLQEPNYVPTVVNEPGMVSVAPVSAPVATVVPVAQPQSEVNYRTVYRKGKVPRQTRKARVQQPVLYTPESTPVYTAPTYVEPYTAPVTTVEPYTQYVEPASVAEPFVSTHFESAQPIVEPLPTYDAVLTSQTVDPVFQVEPAAAFKVEPLDTPPPAAPYEAQVVTQQIVTQPILRPIVEEVQKPLDTGPSVQQPIIQPVVIQPIIQPVVQAPIQQYSDIAPIPAPVQFQAMAAPITVPAPPPPVQLPMPQFVYQQPVVSEVLPAYSLAAPVNSGFEAGMLGSSYCPPDICPTPNPVLCQPGQNLSECFTLNDYQILNTPTQIYTPDAARPLPIAVAPVNVVSSPGSVFVSTPFQTSPVQSAAGLNGTSSKYEALVPPTDMSRSDLRRPEISLPSPLGGADNIPPVPPTSEIENALDAMLSRDAQAPGMLK